MPGRILKMEELSAGAVAELDREKCAFFISVSPLEGHGPHLPLGVDYFDAGFFSNRLAEILISKRPDFDAVIIPTVPLGTQVYRQPGSLRTDNYTLRKVVAQLGESLAVWGFRYIFVLSGHGSPKHIVALESACVKISRKYGIEMHDLFGVLAIKFLKGEFVDRISEQLSRPLTPEEKELLKSDIHGGWWETSMMLLLHPDLVGEFEQLPSTKRDDKEVKSGYIGSPALASREFAEISLRVMNEDAGNIIENILDGRNEKADTVSILYRIPIFRPYSIDQIIIFIMSLIVLVLLIIIIIK